jgi:hypothetical protein
VSHGIFLPQDYPAGKWEIRGGFLGTIVNVRVDRGIGRVVYRGHRDMTSQLKRRFQFLLLVLEVKTSTALYLS